MVRGKAACYRGGLRTAGSRNKATPERRRAILDAALAELLEHGIDGATLDQICSRAGCSKGSLYHHFASKEALVVALYAEAIEAIHAAVEAALGRSRGARDGVERLVRAYLRWFEAQPALGSFVWRVMGSEPMAVHIGPVRAVERRFIAQVLTWLEPHVAAGVVEKLLPSLVVALVMGPSRDFVRGWLGAQDGAAMRRARKVLPAAAWRAIERRT